MAWMLSGLTFSAVPQPKARSVNHSSAMVVTMAPRLKQMPNICGGISIGRKAAGP
jgi:hypothetical protein